jgi:threonine dehydrogenase-like Zn-dependent dehydrogenase
MTVNWSPFVVDEITIVGSRCGPFVPALRLLKNGQVDPTVLIAKRYPLSKAVEAMQEAQKPGMLKVLLET